MPQGQDAQTSRLKYALFQQLSNNPTRKISTAYYRCYQMISLEDYHHCKIFKDMTWGVKRHSKSLSLTGRIHVAF